MVQQICVPVNADGGDGDGVISGPGGDCAVYVWRQRGMGERPENRLRAVADDDRSIFATDNIDSVDRRTACGQVRMDLLEGRNQKVAAKAGDLGF
ncbi:hypothetical protein [Belnapia moabensis]|uniref:hypothetical protein n=1 Tax=Belnapia moabensis TaxID=365533 RepID=UPI0012ED6EBF|nr:hypothetical protein [Belnapia moabensis]